MKSPRAVVSPATSTAFAFQPCQSISKWFCQTPWSWPIPNTSSRGGPKTIPGRATTVGSAWKTPAVSIGPHAAQFGFCHARCPMWAFASRATTSTRSEPQLAASGAEVRLPPKLAQSFPRCPLQFLVHMALSVPRTYTSITPGARDTAVGSDDISPPSDSQGCQAPSYQMCHRALSVPRANTSTRPGPHEQASGPEVQVPPIDDQSAQRVPSQFLCQIALSVPRANKSMWAGPHEDAEGDDVTTPPNDSQSAQPLRKKALCHTALSVPQANRSMWSTSRAVASIPFTCRDWLSGMGRPATKKSRAA